MKRKDTGEKVSDAFRNSLEGGGGVTVTCSYCDREHVAIDSRDIDDGFITQTCDRVEDIMKKAKEDPDGWVLEREVDTIHYSVIDGMVFPDDCPCNGLARYERFIWNHRDRWFSYYAVRKLQLIDELSTLDCVPIKT